MKKKERKKEKKIWKKKEKNNREKQKKEWKKYEQGREGRKEQPKLESLEIEIKKKAWNGSIDRNGSKSLLDSESNHMFNIF